MSEQTTKWRCLVCGYIHEGPEPPDECPVCGVGPEEFEPYEEAVIVPASPAAAAAPPNLRVVIVGAGVAGVSAAEAVRKVSADSQISLISQEPVLPYYRINLTRYLAGEVTEAELLLHPESWYTERRIQLVLGGSVSAISVDPRHVVLGTGETLPCDRLILAGGASAMLPPIRGLDIPGVSVLRTIADANTLLSVLEPGIPVVVIGGGILGLEAAGALALRGASVTVLEGCSHLMPRQLNERAGAMLENRIRAMGINLRLSTRIASVAGRADGCEVQLDGGISIPARRVVVATGISPRMDLAAAAGLRTDKGIVVDDNLATSVPHVYAAGDVAEHRQTIYGLWGVSQFQGTIAGMNAAGQPTIFGGVPRSNVLKVLGIDLFSIGTFAPSEPADELVEQEAGGNYCCFVLRGGRLIGSILLGDSSLSAPAKKAVESGLPLGLPEKGAVTAARVADVLASIR